MKSKKNNYTYSPFITTSGDSTQILAILFFGIKNSDFTDLSNHLYSLQFLQIFQFLIKSDEISLSEVHLMSSS